MAAELTRAATDVQELEPMVETTNHNLAALGQVPIGTLLADVGYYSDANVRSLAEAGPELLIASRIDRNRRAGGAPPRGRIPAGLSVREQMRRKLTTQRGRRLYEQRRWMIEPVFGQIKENRGIRRFQRRGFNACASEWKLIAASHNLGKLYRHQQPRTLARAGRSPRSEASPRSDQPGPTSNDPCPISTDTLNPTTPRRLSTTPTVAKLYATASVVESIGKVQYSHFSVAAPGACLRSLPPSADSQSPLHAGTRFGARPIWWWCFGRRGSGSPREAGTGSSDF